MNPVGARFSRGTLSADSEIYFERADVYEELARAEDADELALDFLRGRVAGLHVLDVGCGAGKYARLLAPGALSIVGVDAAPAQLRLALLATTGLPNVELVLGDALDAPLPRDGFGAAIACWMLGTVLDERRRMSIVERVKGALAPGASFLLIENDSEGQFEELRGRAASSRAYNRWLQDVAGFEIAARLPTRFRFDSLLDARRVFGAIWGAAVAAQIDDSEIEHRALALRWTKGFADPRTGFAKRVAEA